MFVECESSRGMSPPPIGVPLASVSLLTVGPGSVPVWWSSTPGVAEPRPNVGPICHNPAALDLDGTDLRDAGTFGIEPVFVLTIH
jgi:hypothetical protein